MKTDLQPLSQLLSGGRLSISETIRYALNIGAALRRLHSDNRCHGGLTTELIQVSDNSARLLPARPGAMEELTPYAAPEVLQSEPADARTDIFAFGVVLYEMATGRHPFPADNPEVYQDAVASHAYSPIGHEGLDTVVKHCMVKEPAGRWQRMQQIQMELKLLSIAERQKEPTVALRQHELEAAFRAELDSQANMLADLERAVSTRSNELAQAVTAALEDVQVQFAEVEKVLEATQQRTDQFTQTALDTAEAMQREVASLQVSLAGEVQRIEQNLNNHTQTIEVVKNAISRNEDYVERVVEALEQLQNVVLNQPEEHTTAMAAPVAMAS